VEIKGENVRDVIKGENVPVRGSGPPLGQRHIKEGPAGAREPTFIVPTVPPQTLTLSLIKEALKRGD
jgi:hypothetical protein